MIRVRAEAVKNINSAVEENNRFYRFEVKEWLS